MSVGGRKPSGSRGVFAEIVRIQRSGGRAVLATPLWRTGSEPVAAESKLLFCEDGSTLGTVGGGLLEAGVIAAAPEVLAEGTSRVLEFELTHDQAARSGMICGGECAVLVEPILPERDATAYRAVACAVGSHQPVVVVTLFTPEGDTAKTALLPDGSGRRLREACEGGVREPRPQPAQSRQGGGAHGHAPLQGRATLPEAVRTIAEDVLRAGRPRFIQEPIRAHFDPIMPRPTVFVFGGGHVAIPVAHIAGLVGFRVVVIDDRAEFANRERFPLVDDVVAAPVEEAFEALHVDDEGYVVAITRGHAMDEEVVAHALRTRARYIGMIGSKRKVGGVLGRLRERGFSEADLARVHAPIGIDIEAETVEEIAVSIVGELIAVRRRDA